MLGGSREAKSVDVSLGNGKRCGDRVHGDDKASKMKRVAMARKEISQKCYRYTSNIKHQNNIKKTRTVLTVTTPKQI